MRLVVGGSSSKLGIVGRAACNNTLMGT